MTTLDLQAILAEYIESNSPTHIAALSQLKEKLITEVIDIVQDFSDEHFDGESI